jgi:hypothetical protein
MLDAVLNSQTHLTLLSGTSQANSSVSVLDNGKLIGTVQAAADGTWSLQAKLAANTTHVFTETSTDLAGTLYALVVREFDPFSFERSLDC